MQSTPQQPAQVQHTQSVLPPMPSLVNSLHHQQQPSQGLKVNSSLSQSMMQNQNALNNNDMNQPFSTQPMNPNLSLGSMLGIYFDNFHTM